LTAERSGKKDGEFSLDSSDTRLVFKVEAFYYEIITYVSLTRFTQDFQLQFAVIIYVNVIMTFGVISTHATLLTYAI